MNIRFRCPKCGDPVSAPEEIRGQQRRCPHCNSIIEVPEQAQDSPKINQVTSHLIDCPACGNKVSSQTSNCPKCEHSINTFEKRFGEPGLSNRNKNIEAIKNAFDNCVRKGSNFWKQVLCKKKKAAVVGTIAILVLGCGFLMFLAVFCTALENPPDNKNSSGAALENTELLYKTADKFFTNGEYEEAFSSFQKAAEKGHAKAQYMLGVCFNDGSGVKKDHTEAVKWFRKATEQGNVKAQYMLGRCYYEGEGVKQDYTEAIKWFRKVAEQGETDAQFWLGKCYDKRQHHRAVIITSVIFIILIMLIFLLFGFFFSFGYKTYKKLVKQPHEETAQQKNELVEGEFRVKKFIIMLFLWLPVAGFPVSSLCMLWEIMSGKATEAVGRFQGFLICFTIVLIILIRWRLRMGKISNTKNIKLFKQTLFTPPWGMAYVGSNSKEEDFYNSSFRYIFVILMLFYLTLPFTLYSLIAGKFLQDKGSESTQDDSLREGIRIMKKCEGKSFSEGVRIWHEEP